MDLSILIIAHLFPPLTLIWLFIWVTVPIGIWIQDRGPVFYLQERIGKNGKLFTIRKFRTMIPNAESSTGAVWSSKNDARITTIGKFLRWTAIDELPQLWNILKGEMTLVGPRAERPELHKKFVNDIPGFEERITITPGLTGLAQIKGSYDLSPDKKLHYDLMYIDQMSLTLDIKIIIVSICNTLFAKWGHPTTLESPSSPNEPK